MNAPQVPGPPTPLGRADAERPVVLDRRDGPHGEVVLRRHGELLQIIANGCFLMDTSDGRSERLLVTAALDALRSGGSGASGGTDASSASAESDASARPAERHAAPRLLLGGLGVGFSLVAAAREPAWGAITVVEREAAILDWHRDGPLAEHSAAALADPRTELVHADLLAHLREAPRRYDALCLDIDNGPDWTVTEDNDGLYSPAGLAACRARLSPGGVLAIWSARPSPAFEAALRDAGFAAVRTLETPVARGAPDVLFLASHHLANRFA